MKRVKLSIVSQANDSDKNSIFAHQNAIQMASYKRRGYKKSKQDEVASEAHVQDSQTAEVFSALDSGASKTEAWFSKNQRPILGGIIALAVIALGFFGYVEFIQAPKEKEASNELYYPQRYLEQALEPGAAKDSLLNLALNGAEGKYGFLDITSAYSNTKAADIAYYGAGIAYLHLNQYQDAIAYLTEFSASDDLLGALAKGALGDAYAELESYDMAMASYQAAIAHADNEFSTPIYLKKAALLAYQTNDLSKAKSFAEALKERFPDSPESVNIDGLIGLATK